MTSVDEMWSYLLITNTINKINKKIKCLKITIISLKLYSTTRLYRHAVQRVKLLAEILQYRLQHLFSKKDITSYQIL